MHHHMPPSKNWVAQFKRGDFSTYDAPCPRRHKTVTTPEIIHQIHELILEDHRILAKSIAEQLGISREWVVLRVELSEILRCRMCIADGIVQGEVKF